MNVQTQQANREMDLEKFLNLASVTTLKIVFFLVHFLKKKSLYVYTVGSCPMKAACGLLLCVSPAL